VYNHEDGTFDEEKRQTIILQAIGVNVAIPFPIYQSVILELDCLSEGRILRFKMNTDRETSSFQPVPFSVEASSQQSRTAGEDDPNSPRGSTSRSGGSWTILSSRASADIPLSVPQQFLPQYHSPASSALPIPDCDFDDWTEHSQPAADVALSSWQEEAHWMSFRNAVNVFVQKRGRRRSPNSISYSQYLDSQPTTRDVSQHQHDTDSDVSSLGQQLLQYGLNRTEISTNESPSNQPETRIQQALAQAEADELEFAELIKQNAQH
jgi:hypothetical protein